MSQSALNSVIDAPSPPAQSPTTMRAEHPSIGFTRIVVGDCAGGDGASMTEFNADWDMAIAAEFYPVWMQRNYMNGSLLDVEDLLDVVEAVLHCRGTIPSVTVTPRAPREA